MDGSDLEMTLRKHRYRRVWLEQAELFLHPGNNVCTFSCGPMDRDWSFVIEVPREVWEPQLRAQIAATKAQLAGLDSAARRYVEAALEPVQCAQP